MNTPCKFDGRHGSVAESKSLVNYTSNDRCLGKTITNLRVTADLNEVAVLLDSGQTEKLSSKNSVEQYCASEAISVQFSRSNTFKKPVQDNRRPPNGNHVKRATYSLEQVLRSLDEVMASGKAILEALATANSKKLSAKQGGDSSISGKPLATKSSTGMKRGTYELGKVADMLDTGVRNGVSLNDSLNGVSHGNFEENGTIFSAKIQRNTYDLSDESTRLDDSQQSEISLEELLKELGCEGNGVTDDTMASTKYKRGTYDLDHVSGQLDDNLSSGKCLEDSLEQISLENNNQYNQSVQDKRRTYDLCDVSSELDQRLKSSSPLDDSLCQNWTPDTGLDPTASDKRRTYNLNNVSNELDRSLNSGQCVEDSLEQISSTDPEYYQSAYEKRRTYDLTDVSLNFHLSQQDLPRLCGSSTPDKSSSPQCSSNEVVMDSSTLPKNNTDTNGISGREDAAEKRKTYTVDNSPAAVDNSLSNGSNIQNSHLAFSKNSSHPDGINGASYDKPAASILSGNNKKELTPGQWIEQMEELENSPEVSSVKTKYSKSRKECSHKEINSNGSDMKNGEQQVSCTSEFNFEQSDSGLKSKFETRARLSSNSGSSSESSPRSSHVKSKSTLGSRSLSGPKSSSGLSFGSSSEIASRSLSCSRPTSELKSNSSPDFTSSSGPSFKKDCLVESLKEISPGVRNYLTNKLGLTEEQCIAVHRKLSNGSEKSFDSSSLEHHKTYSMEDVAHSLDIATSQGLPMTKVLNNLELENQKVSGDDGVRSYENIKTIQNNMKEHLSSRPSAVEQQGQEPDVDKKEQNTTNKNDSKRSVKHRSNIVQSKFSLNRRTYTLSSGSYSVDGKPSFKLSATKAVYKPSAKLHSFSHLLGGRSVKSQLRNSKAGIDESKRNTYTLESVAETLEKAQDEGVTMIDALKRLSGSCSVEQSESCAEKRKTYSLEDVSNTLESGTASGVPIVDTLRKIADPDGTESGKSSKAETPSQSSKKKAPPKPKRTFSKPEIKFVSDSFVIEYFTSPKKPQSTSSEKNGNKSNIQEAANKSSLDNAEKLDGQGALSGTQQTSANEGDKEKAKQLFTSNEISSLKRGELKPKEKVVNDLDNLLVKLAAEVDKTKELDLSGLERNPSASCGLLPSVAEPAQDSTGSSMNLVEKPCEESVSKTVKLIADSHHSSADCEPTIGFEGTSDSDSAKPELKEANTEKLEDVDPCDEAVPGTSEEVHDVLKPVLLQQVENSLETVAEVEKAAHTEAISVCIDGEIGDKKLTVPIQKGEIPFSDDKMCSGDDCLHSTKPEMAENELDADVVPRDQLETIDLEETDSGVGKTDNVGLSFVPDKPDGCRGLEDGVELSAEEGEFQLNASKSGAVLKHEPIEGF